MMLLPTRICLIALAVCCGISTATRAQERTAGGTLDTQMSWNALKNLTDKNAKDVTVIRTDLNAMESCAKSGKLWKRGTGCVAAAVTPTPPVDTTDYDKMVACADIGQLYDKSAKKCVAINTTKKGCTWKDSMCPYSNCMIRTRLDDHSIVWINIPAKWEHGDVYAYTKKGEDNYNAAQCRDGKFVKFYTGT